MKTLIHRVTYDPFGGVFCDDVTRIVNPIHKTPAEFLAYWVETPGWVAMSGNQIARVDGAGFLDVVTYLEMENEQ